MHTPPKNLELEDGMYAWFYCAASGDPVPTIYWQDKVQEPNPNVFEINEVNISHVGVYKCTARSGKKSKDSYAFLSVNGHHRKYMLRAMFACYFLYPYTSKIIHRCNIVNRSSH